MLPLPPPPAFGQRHVARLADTEAWGPYVRAVLARHGLADERPDLVAGWNATYPTFLAGDVVVKLFGGTPWWQGSHRAELAAHRLLVTDSAILAPALVADGQLYEGNDNCWPYLVTARVRGVASWRANLSPEQRRSLAEQLGTQIGHVHRLQTADVPHLAERPVSEVVEAAGRSCLPGHLVGQVEDYLARIGPQDRVFVHGDLVANHAYLVDGQLAGIIDWGDAVATDRHYELGKLYFELLGCDRTLLPAFLEASRWPVDRGFARKSLGLALKRQAVGLAQHHSFDVFEPVSEVLPLADIATLDDLAAALFDV